MVLTYYIKLDDERGKREVAWEPQACADNNVLIPTYFVFHSNSQKCYFDLNMCHCFYNT